MAETAALIGIDWGTTSLRAYLLAAGGSVLDRAETGDGILAAAGRFPEVLDSIIAPWIGGAPLPVVMSGMIGSRQGWVEIPYLTCPIETTAVARGLVRIGAAGGAGGIFVVPGLTASDPWGIPDVMRGEETQILGAMAALGRTSGSLVLPGTHSKWVTVEDGHITGFATYMTGEVFAALKGHTILGRLMAGEAIDAAAFRRGVETCRDDKGPPGRLLHRIFSARTLGLFDRLAPAETGGYLSGLLVGAEIAAATPPDGRRIVIVANPALAELYAQAARVLGLETETAPADCVTAGHVLLARAAQLI